MTPETQHKRLQDRRALLATTLGGIAFMGALSTDSFLPAMVAVADAFAVNMGQVQFALASFVLGGTFGQIFVGPLADRYGRRWVLLSGLVVYVAATVAIMMAASMTEMIALRFVQGLVASTGRIVVRAIVRDLYSRDLAAQMFAYIAFVGSMVPVIGSITSAQLLENFGWPAVFFFMAVVAAILAVLFWHYIDETLETKNLTAMRALPMLRNYAAILSNRVFLSYVGITIGNSVGLHAFLAGSAAILIGSYGLTPTVYSFVFAAVMIANTAANYLGGRLVVRLGADRMIFIGAAISAASGGVILVLALTGVNTTWALIVPMMAFMFAFAFLSPSSQAGALAPFAAQAGTASSAMGIIQGLSSAATGAALGLLPGSSFTEMAVFVAAGSGIILLFYGGLIRRLPRDHQA
jgi:DHA1 family bicyclomycin/chloramphenicol resistance-like MFS transporter